MGVAHLKQCRAQGSRDQQPGQGVKGVEEGEGGGGGAVRRGEIGKGQVDGAVVQALMVVCMYGFIRVVMVVQVTRS